MKSLIAFFIALNFLPAVAESQDKGFDIFEKLNWDPPSNELLSQKYCPIDSTADAMVVQKEMEFLFVEGNLNVITRKRIKIYTDRGLSYAEFKEFYDDWTDIKSIEAQSYSTDGQVTQLTSNDIHDEVLIRNEKGTVRWATKSFAIPNVTAGSVVDVKLRIVYLRLITPPVFRFQEEIPVGIARFIMNPKPSRYYTYNYSYAIANKELINPTPYFHEDNFVCEASNIPAIENEIYPLPKRNLVTALWINFKGASIEGIDLDYASSWASLLKDYGKGFTDAFESSKKVKKLADSLMAVTTDRRERIILAHDIVRDRWEDIGLMSVGGTPWEINDLMKRKTLDPEDKATLLWAILKYMGIESEVIWVCSDNSDYSPMSNVPSLRAFDHALTWIPGDTLFLNPGDPGGDVGILDEAFSERMMCRPMAKEDFISTTPKIDRTSGTMVDLKLSIDDKGTLTGSGTITYHNQDAIEARRIFRKKGTAEAKKALDHLLFRDDKEVVKTFTVLPDSLQTPDIFQVTCNLKLEKYFDPQESDFELPLYPGATFDTTILDYNPPRKYPIYFNSKKRNVYTVAWNFGDLYKPTSFEGLNQSVDVTLLDYKLLTEYDSTQNILTVRRQYSRVQKLFDPGFTPSFEKFLQDAKKCDLSTIGVVKK